MQDPKNLSDKSKKKRLPADWGGLSNEPRNENLARIREPGSFEKDDNDQDKECGPSLVYRFQKNKGGKPRGKNSC